MYVEFFIYCFLIFVSLFFTDTRLNINKELPTTKWRRDRRIRLSSEYHNHEAGGIIKPLGESNQTVSTGCNTNNSNSNNEIPLDMTVTSISKPPPPYREPLPGSTFLTLNVAIPQTSPNITMARPSVITQAPKREIASNQENKDNFKKNINSFTASATGLCFVHFIDFILTLFYIDFSITI